MKPKEELENVLAIPSPDHAVVAYFQTSIVDVASSKTFFRLVHGSRGMKIPWRSSKKVSLLLDSSTIKTKKQLNQCKHSTLS